MISIIFLEIGIKCFRAEGEMELGDEGITWLNYPGTDEEAKT